MIPDTDKELIAEAEKHGVDHIHWRVSEIDEAIRARKEE